MDPFALMDFLGLSIGEVERYVLVLSRLTGMFLSAPFFSRAVGPRRIKTALLLGITIVIFPLVSPWPHEGSASVAFMVAAATTEVAIGAVFGMLVHWVLVSVQVAGGLIGFQMGLSMAMVMDPTSGLQEGVLSNLLYLVTLILFLNMNGHHLLIEGVARSFQSLPLGSGLPSGDVLIQAGVAGVLQLFKLGILIAAPIIAATKLLYLGMGLINRASPQIQVFFLAMPIAQMIGFVLLGLTMALFAQVMAREIDGFFSLAYKVLGL
ncbi:MAG: flagellar biosynthetic protein FliR [Magnetococcales bacterium]|nr:flagellar biosynthetic protein FliR [Magnetococcales bacterium]